MRHVDRSGKKQEREFDCKFMLPTELVGKSDTLSLDEYKTWLDERDRSDIEKRRKLLNKIVFVIGKEFKGGREVRYWSCFVPSRNVWDILSANAKLPSDREDDQEPAEGSSLSLGFSGGLYTSTKGMPTGISMELKPRGSAGYLPNFYILVEDPSLSFDIGRKAIQSRQQGMLRDIAYQRYREFLNRVQKYLAGSIEENPTSWERDEIFNTIDQAPPLNSKVSRFLKRPNGQEATVAAIFFELIGAKVITELQPLISGYKGRYDLYAKWDSKNVVLEFKYDVSGLLKDFNDERKMFDEIDCLVVWEITEKDRSLAQRRGISVDKIEASALSKRTVFPHAQHELHIDAVRPLFVIELKGLV